MLLIHRDGPDEVCKQAFSRALPRKSWIEGHYNSLKEVMGSAEVIEALLHPKTRTSRRIKMMNNRIQMNKNGLPQAQMKRIQITNIMWISGEIRSRTTLAYDFTRAHAYVIYIILTSLAMVLFFTSTGQCTTNKHTINLAFLLAANPSAIIYMGRDKVESEGGNLYYPLPNYSSNTSTL